MFTKEQLIQKLREIEDDKNTEEIKDLIQKIEKTSEGQLQEFLKDMKIKNDKDIQKAVNKRNRRREKTKFTPLNEVVSYGINGKTLHIHLIPKDARSMLTKEGQQEAKKSLIDALEKVKQKMKEEKGFEKVEEVYAISGIIRGFVAGWFNDLDFKVKTLPIEEAKKDKELKRFYRRFKNQKKLGRASLSKEKLMSEDWEEKKNDLKKGLGIQFKDERLTEKLKNLKSTDEEMAKKYNMTENEKNKVKTQEEIY